jgi:hypothetical protein
LLRVKKAELIDQLVQGQAFGKPTREKSSRKNAKTKTAKGGAP